MRRDWACNPFLTCAVAPPSSWAAAGTLYSGSGGLDEGAGRTAVIMGGSGYLGRAMASGLAEEGGETNDQ